VGVPPPDITGIVRSKSTTSGGVARTIDRGDHRNPGESALHGSLLYRPRVSYIDINVRVGVDPIGHRKASGMASRDLRGQTIPVALAKLVDAGRDVTIEVQTPICPNVVHSEIREAMLALSGRPPVDVPPLAPQSTLRCRGAAA
jgi:hypothetical protein